MLLLLFTFLVWTVLWKILLYAYKLTASYHMDVLMDCILQIINVVYSTECVLFESKSSGSTISI